MSVQLPGKHRMNLIDFPEEILLHVLYTWTSCTGALMGVMLPLVVRSAAATRLTRFCSILQGSRSRSSLCFTQACIMCGIGTHDCTMRDTVDSKRCRCVDAGAAGVAAPAAASCFIVWATFRGS